MASIGNHVYTDAKTIVRTVYGNSTCFEVKGGMHQGSALSPLLFVIATEALSTEFTVALPWKLLYANDLVVIGQTENDKWRTSEANAEGCKLAMWCLL